MARQCSGKPQYGYKSWDNVVQIGIAPATTKNIVVVIPKWIKATAPSPLDKTRACVLEP